MSARHTHGNHAGVALIDYDRPFQKHLRRGEALLWVGRPRQGVMFRKTDWGAIPFSAAVAAGLMTWEAAALGLWGRAGFNPCPATIGAPLVALGLYLLAGRFFHDAWQRGRTWYAVTDRRAIILYVGKTVCLNGVAFDEPGLNVVREDHPDGTGTLVFETPEVDPYWVGRAGRSGFYDFGRPSFPAFEGIERVDEVEALVRSGREALTAATAKQGT